MSKNIFEEYQDAKQRLIEMARKAKAYGWIDAQRERDIVDKINNAVLTLGVIGQMKCGKSTFLNAFVFGDNVLPAATTPMTAALSVITYGQRKEIEAEFYTTAEWDNLKKNAGHPLEGATSAEQSRIKAAKELMSKATSLGGNVQSLLGTKKIDSLDNLEQYVGADGRYVAITKSVIIRYPAEYLKGVEIVDTPGFNDPIVSREERTKEFLKRADVVLLMLYAGRAFDATDRDILFKNVRQCGIGKILIGVNKYDIPFGNGESEDEIINNVKAEIRKACAEVGDDTMTELVTERDPILLSAEMALLAHLPMSVIEHQGSFKTTWQNACENFEIQTTLPESRQKEEMAKKSRISELIEAVQKIIQQDKEEVLLRKPANAIKGAATEELSKIESELRLIIQRIDDLEQPDDELEERQSKLARAERRITKKIDSLGDGIESSIKDIIRKGNNEMEDEVDATCKQLESIVDNMSRWEDQGDVIPRLESELNKLKDRKLKRVFERIVSETKREINKNVREFCEETEEILLRLDSDFDARELVRAIEKQVEIEADRDTFRSESGQFADNTETSFFEGLLIFAGTPTVALIEILSNHSFAKAELRGKINEIRNKFDAREYLNKLVDQKDDIIEKVKTTVIDQFLTPMQEQLKEIRSNVEDREKAKAKAIAHKGELERKLATLKQQYAEMFGGE